MTKKETAIYKDRSVFGIKKLHDFFKIAPNKTVSDIGAGFGHMQKPIEDIGGDWQPFDYVPKMDFSTIWDVSMPAPENTKKAGLVIMLEVLEHLPNPQMSLKNIADHMEKGGYLILSTPNPQSSKNRLHLLLKGTLYAFQPKHIKEYHVFTPWEHIVTQFLKEAGFELLEYAIVDTHYKDRKTSSFKDWFKKRVENFIERRYPLSMGMSYGMVAKKI
jgi:SAM-dependent methyltransferase